MAVTYDTKARECTIFEDMYDPHIPGYATICFGIGLGQVVTFGENNNIGYIKQDRSFATMAEVTSYIGGTREMALHDEFETVVEDETSRTVNLRFDHSGVFETRTFDTPYERHAFLLGLGDAFGKTNPVVIVNTDPHYKLVLQTMDQNHLDELSNIRRMAQSDQDWGCSLIRSGGQPTTKH